MEVSVLPWSGPARLSRLAAAAPRRRGGAGDRRRAGSRRLAVGRSWPPPPVTAAAGWAERATGPRTGLQPPSGPAGTGTGKCRGFRPRHAGAACCRRGRDVELRRGPRAGASRAGDAAAPVRRPHRGGGGRELRRPPVQPPARRGPLGVSRAAAHGAGLCGSPRISPASRAQAGGGGPPRGVGTSRVTDLFEGGGWGRVGCARTIFSYSSAVLWTSLDKLFQLILLLLLAFGASRRWTIVYHLLC